ncbi:MAG: hypothetical protein Q9181_003988 [Wetmoreana brouardii]
MVGRQHAGGRQSHLEDDDSSEWEYEYDETETESFYVTLDCSSASHRTRAIKKTTPPVEPDPSYAAKDQENEDQQGPDAGGEDNLPIDPALRDSLSLQNTRTTSPPTSTDPQSRVQILDFHTQNPLISYNSQIYSCTWGSTIGTDIVLASPSSLAEIPSAVTPLHTSPDVTVLGTSCVKLTARPVTITPRTNAPPSQDQATDSSRPTIPLDASANNTKRKQASFLESLMMIKAAKGETDEVTVHAQKVNQGNGWRAQNRMKQKLAEEMAAAAEAEEPQDAANEANDNDTNTVNSGPLAADQDTVTDPQTSNPALAPQHQQPPTSQTASSPAKRGRGRGRGAVSKRIGRPRGSRGRKPKGMGGLFRDYVPDVGDEAGADIRGAADRTPGRWEEVEGRSGKEAEEGERQAGDGGNVVMNES